ncbi:MAG: T9SS type A sorting domain-containing protein [Cyclobacteriaceae bacterium]
MWYYLEEKFFGEFEGEFSGHTNQICTSGTTISLNNAPPAMPLTWDIEPETLIHTSNRTGVGTSAFIKAANSSSQGAAVVTFQEQQNCNFFNTAVEVWVGKPKVEGTLSSGQNLVHGGLTNTICKYDPIQTEMTLGGATSATWSLVTASPSNISWGQNENDLSFYLWQTNQTATFRLTTSNTCGTTTKDYKFKAQSCGGSGGCNNPFSFSVSPNPANLKITAEVPITNITAPCPGGLFVSKPEDYEASAFSDLRRIYRLPFAIAKMRVYSIDGKEVLYKEFDDLKKAELDLTDLRKGVYILEIHNAYEVLETHRFIIDK